jgi:opacity protein-like surface antigen
MNQTLTSTIGAALIITGSLAAQSAGAAERGFYVGVYYGQTDKASEEDPYVALANRNYESFGFNPQSTVDSFDAKDVSYGFLGGFRISEHWAIEGGFMDLGEVAYKDESTGLDHSQDQIDVSGSVDHSNDAVRTWNQQISSSSRGLSVAALGIWPITYRSEIYAKGGIVLSSSELDIRISNGTDSASNNPQQKTSFDVLVGAGASYTFAEIYAIRLEYQRIFDEGDESTDEHDMDIISLGVTVTF